ncbi:16S rRNA (cytosine(967)-C(5))-methyltransferase RsmB [Biomaibacter acetigenes]|uniref:16S rRNA (cytosine(967)-C(5))-methyltransferase n=1 Tax=Biomaibacter acetigenes TaxID=2316383 RepID=A0A3G2R4Y6_9FIRM|nr:16S rRNA (cytosine(967)-C(5))-methyltransferase RsmB [Biomaibacter acetigenes]
MKNARELAIEILIDSQQGSYSNLALNKYLTQDIPAIDRAFVTELVYGVLKYRMKLDYIISQFSKIELSKMSWPVLNTLRIGIYQLMFLDKVPVFAAVNESVNLAKKMENPGAARFVNAVLRNIVRNKNVITYPDPVRHPQEFLSIYYSFPKWMVERWIKLYGFDFTRDLCEAFNQKPRVCIRINTLKTNKEKLKSTLESEGVKVIPGVMFEEAFYIEDIPQLKQLKSFHDGLFQPQDESSMIAARALGVRSGDMVLDVAAAPGGKTTHIAQIMANKGSITAWDIHPHRVELIKETCRRLGTTIVDAQVRDSRLKDKDMHNKFDKVLVDAPCSGLGVIRRKPDIKWSKKPEDISVLTTEQQRILEVCSQYVKLNGILVYSTCSIEPEENQQIVEAFLENNGNFVYDDMRPYLPEKLAMELKEPYGWIQLYPNIHKVDGFFVARLKRVGK